MSYPFLIWTMQRTGGTSLMDLLMEMSEHRKADHEPFNWRKSPRQFAQVSRNWAETGDEDQLLAALARIFSDRYLIKHCYELHPELNYRLMAAAAQAGYRQIHLLRRDEMSRLISKFVAEANGTWFKDYSSIVYRDIREGRRKLDPLPVDRIVARYRACRTSSEQIREYSEALGVDLRELWYEDLYVGDRASRLDHLHRLFEFLGFEQDLVERHREKMEERIFRSGQDTASIVEFVPNLQAVIDALLKAGCPQSGEAVFCRRPAKSSALPRPPGGLGNGVQPPDQPTRSAQLVVAAELPGGTENGWLASKPTGSAGAATADAPETPLVCPPNQSVGQPPTGAEVTADVQPAAAERERAAKPAGTSGAVPAKAQNPSIHVRGHRDYLGCSDDWDQLADLQLEFLRRQGLRPSDKFIDIGCGALCGGSRLIPYLDAACYHGLEKHIEPILYGVALEIGVELYREKAPRFVVSDVFEFGKFRDKFTCALAHSVFTELPARHVFLCLSKLAQSADRGCRLYATFVPEAAGRAAEKFEPQQPIRHSREELELLGSMTGWESVYMGDWGHPRGQQMMEFVRV